VVGADADVVLWNPGAGASWACMLPTNATDYNICMKAGTPAAGPSRCIGGGELLVDGERWLGRPGTGRYLPRGSGQVL